MTKKVSKLFIFLNNPAMLMFHKLIRKTILLDQALQQSRWDSLWVSTNLQHAGFSDSNHLSKSFPSGPVGSYQCSQLKKGSTQMVQMNSTSVHFTCTQRYLQASVKIYLINEKNVLWKIFYIGLCETYLQIKPKENAKLANSILHSALPSRNIKYKKKCNLSKSHQQPINRHKVNSSKGNSSL